MSEKTAELVDTYNSSNLTQKTFCTERGIGVSTLQYHLSKSKKTAGKAKKVQSGHFFPLSAKKDSQKPRTVLLIHGDIATAEIAELLRTVTH